MKRLSYIATVITIMICTAFTASGFLNQKIETSMENEKIVELVVYKVKMDQIGNYDLLVKQVNEIAANFDGFVSRKVHQSPEDSTIFMDYVIWESLEQAQQAAQKMPKMENFAPFMGAIEEVQSFKHFEIR